MNPMQIISVFQGDQKEYLEQFYERYLKSPESIPSDWRELFDSLEKKETIISNKIVIDKNLQPEDIPYDVISANLNLKVQKLIQDYRRQGHYTANTDPLQRKGNLKFFNLEKYEIAREDLKKLVTVNLGKGNVTDTISNIIQMMENIYCSTIGFEFFYIRDERKRN